MVNNICIEKWITYLFGIYAFRIIVQISQIDFFFWFEIRCIFIFQICWWTICVVTICKSMINFSWAILSHRF